MAMPVHAKHSGRKIMSRSKATVRELVKPFDGGIPRGLESQYQRMWLYVLMWYRDISECYEETKEKIIVYDGGTFKYFPDFEVIRDDGSIDVIEIKPHHIAIQKEMLARHTLIGEYLNSQGIGFRVLTEKCLPVNQIGISNLRRLKWFAIKSETALDELRQIAPISSTTFGDLASEHTPQKVMEMLGKQLAFIDLNQTITSNTEIRKIEENDYVSSY